MNWAGSIKRISDVCEVIAGQSPEGKYYSKEGDGLPFYQGKKEFTERIIGKPTTWTTKVTKEAIEGDILMSVRAPVGPINFCAQHSCIGRGLAAIRASEKVNNDYLFYFLLKQESEIVGNSGAVFNSINKTQIGNIPIPIPSLTEQKQIVAILDKAFAAIDQAKANIEKNIQNAQELFQSKLNQIFSQKGDGWEEKTLGEVCDILGGGTPSKKNESFYGGSIPWATVRDMNHDILTQTDHSITDEGLKNSSSKIISKNHVVIATRVGLGKICKLKQDTAINQDLKGLVPNEKYNILNDFIFWWFKSISQKVIDAGTGATVQGVKLTFIKELSFPLTTKNEQERVINTMNAFSKDTEALLNTYSNKLSSLEELKKTILQKAFVGELTH
ncbi:MAG TPA: restriction endonuclease subunit S [Gammaproteobacteria bacterium]|nr:restriction endonuclease subunit S [Gammaproteobacteria bacterium]